MMRHRAREHYICNGKDSQIGIVLLTVAGVGKKDIRKV